MNDWVDDAMLIARALAEFDNHELHDLSPADQDRYGRMAVFVVERMRDMVRLRVDEEHKRQQEHQKALLLAQAVMADAQH